MVEQPGRRQVVQHEGTEAADGALLDGDQHLVLQRQAADEVGIQRLGEPRIGDGGAEPAGRQVLGRQQAFLQPAAIAQQGDLGAFSDDAAAADLQRFAAVRQVHAGALAARIA